MVRAVCREVFALGKALPYRTAHITHTLRRFFQALDCSTTKRVPIPNDASSESPRLDVSYAGLFGTDGIPTDEISTMDSWPRGVRSCDIQSYTVVAVRAHRRNFVGAGRCTRAPWPPHILLCAHAIMSAPGFAHTRITCIGLWSRTTRVMYIRVNGTRFHVTISTCMNYSSTKKIKIKKKQL